jgi:hypothetical protein
LDDRTITTCRPLIRIALSLKRPSEALEMSGKATPAPQSSAVIAVGWWPAFGLALSQEPTGASLMT